MTIQELLEEIRALPVAERKELVKRVIDTLDQVEPSKKRSLHELRGPGKEIWAGVDVEDYINQQRDEWDKRP